MAVDHGTQLEIENGFRQYDLTLDIVRYYLEPERPFALRVPLILDLQRKAVAGIEAEAGQIRRTSVGINKSQIEADNSHYINALEDADAAARKGGDDVSEMEKMIRAMLSRQLLSVIEKADGEKAAH